MSNASSRPACPKLRPKPSPANSATKQDLKELGVHLEQKIREMELRQEQKMLRMEHRLTLRLGAMTIAGIAVVGTLITTLVRIL